DGVRVASAAFLRPIRAVFEQSAASSREWNSSVSDLSDNLQMHWKRKMWDCFRTSVLQAEQRFHCKCSCGMRDDDIGVDKGTCRHRAGWEARTPNPGERHDRHQRPGRPMAS